jgi:hypothetical protein
MIAHVYWGCSPWMVDVFMQCMIAVVRQKDVDCSTRLVHQPYTCKIFNVLHPERGMADIMGSKLSMQ